MAGQPRVVQVCPQVFVTDMERALSFCRDGLGFEVGFTYGEPPHYALVERDGQGMNLRHVDRLPMDPAAAAKDDLLAASFLVDGVEALFEEFRARGLRFHQECVHQPWGESDFIVLDPDGNLIHFMSNASAD